jgi:hypothetical protein
LKDTYLVLHCYTLAYTSERPFLSLKSRIMGRDYGKKLEMIPHNKGSLSIEHDPYVLDEVSLLVS